jgi:hypothetical protein
VGHSATSDLIKNDVIFECNETVLKQQEILKREIQDCLQMLSKVKIWIQVAPSGARAPHSFPAPRGMTARPARTLPEMTPRPSRFFPLHPRTAQHPKSRGRQQLWRVHPGLGCRVQGAGCRAGDQGVQSGNHLGASMLVAPSLITRNTLACCRQKLERACAYACGSAMCR